MSLETTKYRPNTGISKVMSRTVQSAYTLWAILTDRSATGIDKVAKCGT
jgi:hypothetical protein